MNTKSQSISLLLYVHWNYNVSDLLQVLFGDRQWKGGPTQLQCLCMCASISWQYSDFHTLQNKIISQKISFYFLCFFCTYICIKLHFTCVCLLAPARSLLKRTTGVESVVFYPRAPWGNLGLKMFLSIWKRRGAVDQSWRWPNTPVSRAVKLCYTAP